MTHTDPVGEKSEAATDENAEAVQNLIARVNRLETLVEQQQKTIDAQRDRLAAMASDEGEAEATPSGSLAASSTRRGVLTAGGLLALLGVGTGATDAQPGNGPDNAGGAVYNWKKDVDAQGNALLDVGSLTMDDNPTAITDLAGDNLSIDESGVLNATVTDTDTRTSISENGVETVQNVTNINFGFGLGVIDEGDGTVTIVDDPIPPTISLFEAVSSPSADSITVNLDSNEPLGEIKVEVTDDGGNTVLVFVTDDFSEDCSGGSCSYFASDQNPGLSSGTYTATLIKAEDIAGNDGADGQSDTVTV